MAVAVAAIVVVVTALDGLGRYARVTGARAFGSDTFLVAQIATAGQSTRRELAEKQQRNPAMGRPDLRFLERYAGGRGDLRVHGAARAAMSPPGASTFENAAISGTTPTLADLRDLGIGRGPLPAARTRAARGAQVAVIGADIADALFPGARRRWASRSAWRAAASRWSASRRASVRRAARSLDRFVWMPLTTFERHLRAAADAAASSRAPKDGVDDRDGRERRPHGAAGEAAAPARRGRQLRPADARRRPATSCCGSPSASAPRRPPISAMALLAADRRDHEHHARLGDAEDARKSASVGRWARRAAPSCGKSSPSRPIVSLAGGLAGTLLTAARRVACSPALSSSTSSSNGSTVAWAIGAAGLERPRGGLLPGTPRHADRRHRGREGGVTGT
ncbi:MAG: hypothetical protein M0C28_16245 [Candidatus Moduliflexus flocculans]|nr:hypothetical protein [Candidatus Moduliflexus flocculans]